MTRNARGVASIVAVLAELTFLASGVPGGGLAGAGRHQTDWHPSFPSLRALRMCSAPLPG